MAWGAAIGGLGTYLVSSPMHPNFYLGPTWSMVKDDIDGKPLQSAYLGSFAKSILMEILSLGKIVTVRGKSQKELNQKVNSYFSRHQNASTVGSFTIEFHSRSYGENNLTEASLTDIKDHFDENSTILFGNCFAGKNFDMAKISELTHGATVIGHYGYQNDGTFLLNGSLTGGNANMMGTGHLDKRMFKHDVAHNGKLIQKEALLTTHISNSGKITYRSLSPSFVARKIQQWGKVKSGILMILGAIFNPTK